uniref:Uncharacterized protein n=1 Tax=uncultured marine virus TaxID=186617 RepID=A0A0F7L1X7_9VIRU|nr:hypothetical protein [uncultured marine virus]
MLSQKLGHPPCRKLRRSASSHRMVATRDHNKLRVDAIAVERGNGVLGPRARNHSVANADLYQNLDRFGEVVDPVERRPLIERDLVKRRPLKWIGHAWITKPWDRSWPVLLFVPILNLDHRRA